MNQSRSLESWLVAVDRAIQASCGLSRDDLADCCYADWYEDGVTVASAARKAIRASGAWAGE